VAAAIEARVRNEGERTVVDLRGDLDQSADTSLADAYGRARQSGAARILLNFTDVDYINSTGIALIVSVLSAARKDGLSILAFGVSDHYRQVFEITRLTDYMPVYADEETAAGNDISRLETKEA
jgi:anti-sigma B factor antagonist